jgi:ATP-dependent Clp protease adapter protein ClpS
MLVHMEGSATVAVSNKKIVEEYTKSLQMAGLTVSMAPDDEFEDSEGEEGDE